MNSQEAIENWNPKSRPKAIKVDPERLYNRRKKLESGQFIIWGY